MRMNQRGTTWEPRDPAEKQWSGEEEVRNDAFWVGPAGSQSGAWEADEGAGPKVSGWAVPPYSHAPGTWV